MKSLEWYKDKNLIYESKTVENLAEPYLEKARENIVTMELLNRSKDHRKELEIPEDYDPSEWVVITGYYAMYFSALSVLAKIGYKSKNHSATIKALEDFLVKKRNLEKKYTEDLKKAKIKKDEIESLDKVKDRREIAQYSVTKETSEKVAERTIEDAHDFADRMEKLLDLMNSNSGRIR